MNYLIVYSFKFFGLKYEIVNSINIEKKEANGFPRDETQGKVLHNVV